MVRILLEPDMNVEPAHQWLVVRDTPEGRALAVLLTENAPFLKRGDNLMIPHVDVVDRQILNLIDQLAHARFASPSLVQLTMVEDPE